MNDKLLRTCKRLNRFTLEELEIITETDKNVLRPVLEEFVLQKHLVFRSGFYYYYKEKQVKKALLKQPLSFQYQSADTLKIIMRGFCADIPTTKIMLLTGLSLSCITDFYRTFRTFLYAQQREELSEKYRDCPQSMYTRNFFEQPMYFYIYDNRVYVVPKPLATKKNCEMTEWNDYQEFKRVYSFISRGRENHKFQTNFEHRIAELIWRRNKAFNEMLAELKELINA